MSASNMVIGLVLVALVYHLGPWRPDHASGAGYDEMMDVNVATWDREVIGASKPVLTLFHAPSSASCQQVYPVISEVHRSLRGQVKVTRVNWEENASLAMRYRVETIPALLIFKDGLLVEVVPPEDGLSFNALKARLTEILEGR